MEVIAKCPVKLRSSLVLFPTSRSMAEILNFFVLDSVHHYGKDLKQVESCYNISETARLKNINNDFTDPRQLVNCLSCISTFNRILFFMFSSGEIKKSQIRSLQVTSAFRTPKLNEYVGGSRTSLHLHGLALDVYSVDSSAIFGIIDHVKKIIESYEPVTKCLFPYELISYSPNRIHIGFKWFEKL